MSSPFSLFLRRRQALSLGFCLVIFLVLDAISSSREAHLSFSSRSCNPLALHGGCGNSSFLIPTQVFLPDLFTGGLGVVHVSSSNKHRSSTSGMRCFGVQATVVGLDNVIGPDFLDRRFVGSASLLWNFLVDWIDLLNRVFARLCLCPGWDRGRLVAAATFGWEGFRSWWTRAGVGGLMSGLGLGSWVGLGLAYNPAQMFGILVLDLITCFGVLRDVLVVGHGRRRRYRRCPYYWWWRLAV